MNAAFIAIGMEAEVYVFDRNIDRLRELEILLNDRASTVFSSTLEIEQLLPEVDLVIGAVLVHGARAPHVITREQLGLMKRHAVLVDVAIDQGGCFETSRADDALRPDLRGRRHHALLRGEHAGRGAGDVDVRADQRDDALPAAPRRPRASHRALRADPGFMQGLNVAAGQVTYEPVARDQGLDVHAARRGALAGRLPRRLSADARRRPIDGLPAAPQ